MEARQKNVDVNEGDPRQEWAYQMVNHPNARKDLRGSVLVNRIFWLALFPDLRMALTLLSSASGLARIGGGNAS